MLVATLGYFISGWRHFTLTTALLGLPIALALFYLPESPRWLVTKRRYEQADAVMTQIIAGNGSRYKDAYRQTPPAQSLADEDDEPELNLDYNKAGGAAARAIWRRYLATEPPATCFCPPSVDGSSVASAIMSSPLLLPSELTSKSLSGFYSNNLSQFILFFILTGTIFTAVWQSVA